MPIPVDIPGAARAVLPTLTFSRSAALDGADIEALDVVFSGDEERPINLDNVRWASTTEMSVRIDQQLQLGDTTGPMEAGIWDVRVTNASGATASSSGVLATVDQPAITDLSPGVLCLSQGPRTATITGTSLLILDGQEVNAKVADTSFDFASLADCTAVAHRGVSAGLCRVGELVLSVDALQPWLHPVNVINPETAACISEETINLRIVPPPSIDRVQPPLICVAQENRTITLEGADGLPAISAIAFVPAE